MSAQAEREPFAAEFQHQMQNLEQLEASIAATDAQLAAIRETIHGLGYRSVAQALEETPAPDDSIVPPPVSPPARPLSPLPWMFVVAVVAVPMLFISLGGLKPAASNNRSPVPRATSPQSTSPQSMTTAIAPRDNEAALPDAPDTSSGPRQPEPSTGAPAQEPTAQLAIRSTVPPSEDDPPPVAPPVAVSPPPIATPNAVDTTTTQPTPLLLDLDQIEDARRVQRRLIDLGFLFGAADGNWGPRSQKALREFRAVQGLGNSDTWDEKAQQDLFAATAARAHAAGTFVGGWGISVEQCRQTLDSRPPLTISSRQAEASSTTCQFNSTQRESANEWRIRATCADANDRWNANIRLTLAGSRLTWTSERGTATYLRCPVIWN